MSILSVRKPSHYFAQLTTGFTSLEHEAERFTKVPIHGRICKVDSIHGIADETHFTIICRLALKIHPQKIFSTIIHSQIYNEYIN